MQVLPSGLAIPPLPYTAALLVLALSSVAALYVLRPPVTAGQVVALVPWMALGGASHALYQVGLVPDAAAPLLGAPAVYVSTFVVASAVWIGAVLHAQLTDDVGQIARDLGVVGGGLLLVVTLWAYSYATGRITDVEPFVWLPLGALGAAAITAPAYYLLTVRWAGAVDRAGLGGPVAVYGHAVDGFSTAIGVDIVGTGERTPIPRHIMDFAETLPTYESLGKGWLFVLVKLALALGIVVLLSDLVEEDPTQGNILLAVVAAVGLGPAANNLFLFLLGPAI